MSLIQVQSYMQQDKLFLFLKSEIILDLGIACRSACSWHSNMRALEQEVIYILLSVSYALVGPKWWFSLPWYVYKCSDWDHLASWNQACALSLTMSLILFLGALHVSRANTNNNFSFFFGSWSGGPVVVLPKWLFWSLEHVVETSEQYYCDCNSFYSLAAKYCFLELSSIKI